MTSKARDLASGTFSGAVVAASADFAGAVEAADLSDGTLSIPTTYVTNGSAKAWGRFTAVGTQSILDSLNISSLTDGGTGTSSLGITSAFANASASVPSATHVLDVSWMVSPRSRLSSTSAVEFLTATLAPALQDADLNSFSAHGDLA
jgi:hypothetical protein